MSTPFYEPGGLGTRRVKLHVLEIYRVADQSDVKFNSETTATFRPFIVFPGELSVALRPELRPVLETWNWKSLWKHQARNSYYFDPHGRNARLYPPTNFLGTALFNFFGSYIKIYLDFKNIFQPFDDPRRFLTRVKHSVESVTRPNDESYTLIIFPRDIKIYSVFVGVFVRGFLLYLRLED